MVAKEDQFLLHPGIILLLHLQGDRVQAIRYHQEAIQERHAVIQNLQEAQVTLLVHPIAAVVLMVVDLRTQEALQDHHQGAHLQAEGKIKSLIKR